MNLTNREALTLIDALLPELIEIEGVECVICPPFTALSVGANQLDDSNTYTGV
jgi:triosephosphate isomerase